MKNIITKELEKIEKNHNIKILYACESGSRAWGFPSPDSDYDVRFMYTQSINNYLSINKNDDFLDYPINGELDINGWDLQKVLHQVSKSNVSPFEWLQSPIIYYADNEFKNDLWNLCQSYYSQRHTIHHYLGIARGKMQSFRGDKIGIKTFFYIVRPVLAALWSIKNNTIPPMQIQPLLKLMPIDLLNKIQDLIEKKTKAEEKFILSIDKDLINWVNLKFDYCWEESNKLDKDKFTIDLADDFFIKTINHKSKI